MTTDSFKVGRCYLATNCSKHDDKRILAVTDRDGNRITFGLISGCVSAEVDYNDFCGEFATGVFIDDMPFLVPSSVSPSLQQLEEANAAMRNARRI